MTMPRTDVGKRKRLVPVGLLAAGLVLMVLVSWPKRQPGYMDAYYQVVVAERIAAGQGFTEPFVWNYLDHVESIPHPSHTYWMPLPSLLAAASMFLFGGSYRAATLPFVLCGAALPLLTYVIARRIGASRGEAAVSGGLAALAGFYAPYWTSPDSFAPFALAGSAALLLFAYADKGWRYALGAGICAGLGHLARPDGLLLLAAGLLVLLWRALRANADSRGPRWRDWRPLVWVLAGYCLVMLPWFLRNWAVTGSVLAGGGLQTMLLRNYDEIFAALRTPTVADFLGWGWGNILRSKLDALLSNLLTLLGALMFVLAPPSFWGWWNNRKHRLAAPFAVFAGLLYLAMSLAFTFPGVRGSFFHSAGALLPFLFAGVFPGLRSATAWISVRRKTWDAQRAYRFFSVSLVILALAVTAVLYVRTIGGGSVLPAWNERGSVFPTVEEWLTVHGSRPERVMVNDPPAFYYFTERECATIPSDGLDAVGYVQTAYDVSWLLLEYNHPEFLDAVYEGDVPLPEWAIRETFRDALGHRVILYEWEGKSDASE